MNATILTLTETQKQRIVEELAKNMQEAIKEMDIDLPQLFSSGERVESELDCDLDVDGLYIHYDYNLSCDFCKWSEHWTDPDCDVVFEETDNHSGYIIDIVIYDDYDNEVGAEAVEEIRTKVNDLI